MSKHGFCTSCGRRYRSAKARQLAELYAETHHCLRSDLADEPYDPPERFRPIDYDVKPKEPVIEPEPEKVSLPWHVAAFDREHGESANT